MTKQSTVRVVIHGVDLSFKTDDPEYIRELADFVNEQIDNVAASGKVKAANKVAVLAAFNIADELLKLRKDKSETAKKFSERLDSMLEEAQEAYRSIRLPADQG